MQPVLTLRARQKAKECVSGLIITEAHAASSRRAKGHKCGQVKRHRKDNCPSASHLLLISIVLFSLLLTRYSPFFLSSILRWLHFYPKVRGVAAIYILASHLLSRTSWPESREAHAQRQSNCGLPLALFSLSLAAAPLNALSSRE